MKSTNDLNEIPKTGRIGRFAKILMSKTDKDIFIRIMQDSSEYGKYKPDKKAHWWKNAVDEIRKNFLKVNNIKGADSKHIDL